MLLLFYGFHVTCHLDVVQMEINVMLPIKKNAILCWDVKQMTSQQLHL
jgi:hypothetical protein